MTQSVSMKSSQQILIMPTRRKMRLEKVDSFRKQILVRKKGRWLAAMAFSGYEKREVWPVDRRMQGRKGGRKERRKEGRKEEK